jgi:hypothetical protein
MTAAELKFIGWLGAAAIASVGWFIGCLIRMKKAVVFRDVCEARGIANEKDHTHLEKLIEDNATRSAEQHKEVNQRFDKIDDKIDKIIEKM